jgi:hypothetical protein
MQIEPRGFAGDRTRLFGYGAGETRKCAYRESQDACYKQNRLLQKVRLLRKDEAL